MLLEFHPNSLVRQSALAEERTLDITYSCARLGRCRTWEIVSRDSRRGDGVSDTARELLDAAYSRLGFHEGDLLEATDQPSQAATADWVNKGDWLALAKRVGAEKVFFVNDYPVIVFAEQTATDAAQWIRVFNSVWCMAKPQMLFLARDGELSVLNLTKKPVRQGETLGQHDRLLATAKAAADVQERLHSYRREQVESGRLFEDERFGFDDRADRALIRDLGQVRKTLIKAGLQVGYAHALIGRSIFIRYLEDRRVLDEDYFRAVARRDPKNWPAVVDEASQALVDIGGSQPIYPFVLTNKGFTYALFNRLAADFNGDMFPVDPEEEKAVTETHLNILHHFLLGGKDEKLFFFAYRFDIIPIELISSMYEKFYSLETERRRDEGSYYTPSALVDFVLAEVLTPDILEREPRVIDPACGSGIFLVEAFRRLVRYRVSKVRRPLTSGELRDILRQQIAGIDISSEAIRVAAFSLYLALLHYLDPPNIRANKKLPHLTFATRKKTNPSRHFDILVASDAFRIAQTVSNARVRSRFLSNCADVVVGNPPWGAPHTKNVPAELLSDGGLQWCKARGLSLGDKERSQAFLHRTFDLLRPGGRSGLLISTGVFFKRNETTRAFREQWLGSCTLRKVVNFAAVRDAFFRNGSDPSDPGRQGAIAPFAAVVFDRVPPPPVSHFSYWSAKATAFVRRVQAVVLSWADVRVVEQGAFTRDDTLWKIYWWGGHRDHAFIQRLRLESSFQQVVDPSGTRMRVGFIEASRENPARWLKNYPVFVTKDFESYGPLPKDRFVAPPTRVERRRERNIYEGPRLLIKRGIDPGGRIAARFETANFSFRDSVHCAPLTDRSTGKKATLTEDEAKVVLAILWSSLTRYFLFMTSGTWGLWHDEVKKDVLYSIPIRLPANDDDALRRKIVEAVDALRELPIESDGKLFQGAGLPKLKRDRLVREFEARLDDAVYRLFELTDAERERVEDFRDLDLDFFYRGMHSKAVRPLGWPGDVPQLGRLQTLAQASATGSELCQYVATFVELWEPQLRDQDGRLRWRVVRPSDVSSMIAVMFETESVHDPLPDPSRTDTEEWKHLLIEIDKNARAPTKSKRVYIDGLIRIVTDSEILIIKRNEHRLWTRSAARDDAEAAMVLAIKLSEQMQRG